MHTINFPCAHIFWMYHNFLNVMYILPWRFSKSGIFGIWYDCKAFHEFTIKTILIFDILLNCLEYHFFWSFFCGSKFFNTMSCRNHKMWRNNGSRAEIVIVMWSILFFDVMKWYNKAPFFFCGRKSVIIYQSKVYFPKNLPKFVTWLPFRILLSIAIIEWRTKQSRKIRWNRIVSLSNQKLLQFQIMQFSKLVSMTFWKSIVIVLYFKGMMI